MTGTKRAKHAKHAINDEQRKSLRAGAPALRKKLAAERRRAEPDISDVETLEIMRLLAILETGYLAVAADGQLQEVERQNLASNFAHWLEQDVPEEDMNSVIERFHGHVEHENVPARLARLAEVLDGDSRRVAFNFAVVLAVCDGHVDEDEWGVLGQIAEAFAIPDDEASERFTGIYEMVTGALGDEA